ncbi:type II toxin-antitoxin system RelE/ParE family toxin [Stenoxybacter acetivorans]|uniref:type II toxin-antitoxin system RelE/ParE family toxin n=1 Tax=Stenoxybacter acetivorans TaxID=422441 RepID=UPI00056B795C|nr:type II toxin-antitoxin system RelE/ParE family toxin [Stenoxybacter acetivorans]
MNYQVIFSPKAEEQLLNLYRYLEREASADIAAQYTEEVVAYCEGLADLPYRGIMRDDIRKGLRISHYKKRTVIAFAVDTPLIMILGVFHGGQNYEAILIDV